MPGKIEINLQNVQKTLLLPLWGRAVETQKKKPLLIDKTAVDIIEKINHDFSPLSKNISYISQLAWVARSLHIDGIVRQFLLKHPKALVVNMGCGLDTTFQQIDNGKLLWYDLDLPDVIDLRQALIPESDRSKCIACSLLDDAWMKRIKVDDGVLFLSAGVLYYFEENQMKSFFCKLADVFPGSEIAFDAASPLGVKVANEKVIKAGGMDENSILKWGIKTAKEIQCWDNRIVLIAEYPLFKNIKRNLPFKNKFGTFISDFLNIMFMVHIKFM